MDIKNFLSDKKRNIGHFSLYSIVIKDRREVKCSVDQPVCVNRFRPWSTSNFSLFQLEEFILVGIFSQIEIFLSDGVIFSLF